MKNKGKGKKANKKHGVDISESMISPQLSEDALNAGKKRLY